MTSTRVSVIVPCRNEILTLPRTLAMLESQTRLPDQVVFADGLSSDGSRSWLEAAARTRPWLVLVDNVGLTVPEALNTAFAAADGDLVARMDTHAEYAPDYLSTVVEFLDEHPTAGGAAAKMFTRGRGPWGMAIAATLRRSIGLGGASHRVGSEFRKVSHAFSPCYRRDAITQIGQWDTRLLANEDFEADVRLGKAGWDLWLLPDTSSIWYVRESPRLLFKQMWRYGFYKALTLRLHPESLHLRQLAPPLLVVMLTGAILTQRKSVRRASLVYLVVTMGAGASAAKTDGASPTRGACVPALVHVAWGSGLLMGLARFGSNILGEYIRAATNGRDRGGLSRRE